MHLCWQPHRSSSGSKLGVWRSGACKSVLGYPLAGSADYSACVCYPPACISSCRWFRGSLSRRTATPLPTWRCRCLPWLSPSPPRPLTTRGSSGASGTGGSWRETSQSRWVGRSDRFAVTLLQYSSCGRLSQTSALASEPRAHEGARRACYVSRSLKSGVSAINITTKPAVNSSNTLKPHRHPAVPSTAKCAHRLKCHMWLPEIAWLQGMQIAGVFGVMLSSWEVDLVGRFQCLGPELKLVNRTLCEKHKPLTM